MYRIVQVCLEPKWPWFQFWTLVVQATRAIHVFYQIIQSKKNRSAPSQYISDCAQTWGPTSTPVNVLSHHVAQQTWERMVVKRCWDQQCHAQTGDRQQPWSQSACLSPGPRPTNFQAAELAWWGSNQRVTPPQQTHMVWRDALCRSCKKNQTDVRVHLGRLKWALLELRLYMPKKIW